jgi:hypothetical protein
MLSSIYRNASMHSVHSDPEKDVIGIGFSVFGDRPQLVRVALALQEAVFLRDGLSEHISALAEFRPQVVDQVTEHDATQ